MPKWNPLFYVTNIQGISIGPCNMFILFSPVNSSTKHKYKDNKICTTKHTQLVMTCFSNQTNLPAEDSNFSWTFENKRLRAYRYQLLTWHPNSYYLKIIIGFGYISKLIIQKYLFSGLTVQVSDSNFFLIAFLMCSIPHFS